MNEKILDKGDVIYTKPRIGDYVITKVVDTTKTLAKLDNGRKVNRTPLYDGLYREVHGYLGNNAYFQLYDDDAKKRIEDEKKANQFKEDALSWFNEKYGRLSTNEKIELYKEHLLNDGLLMFSITIGYEKKPLETFLVKGNSTVDAFRKAIEEFKSKYDIKSPSLEFFWDDFEDIGFSYIFNTYLSMGFNISIIEINNEKFI